jgi:DNA polymerase-3 subunit epsilon
MIVCGCDIETTGLSQAEGHRIIEIAMSLYDLETRAHKGAFVQRINPERSIAAEAQRVHGISFDMLADEPKWEEVAPKVVKVMRASHFIVAHNGIGFDLPFIAAELMRVGISVPSIQAVDTMVDARWATPNGKLPNLGELCYSLGVPYDPAKAHGALYDVEVMMASFFKGLDKGFFRVPARAEERKAA